MIMSGKDIDLSLLCPQFVPQGLLLNLQVHGNRNSMMQNITYNPIDQDPFISFLFCFRLPQLLVLTVLVFFRRLVLHLTRKFTSEVTQK